MIVEIDEVAAAAQDSVTAAVIRATRPRHWT
jgi:hypothetical protein